ncbi:MAG: hypothetical protein ACUVYA_11250 [Planctomycetota bacterium]
MRRPPFPSTPQDRAAREIEADDEVVILLDEDELAELLAEGLLRPNPGQGQV